MEPKRLDMKPAGCREGAWEPTQRIVSCAHRITELGRITTCRLPLHLCRRALALPAWQWSQRPAHNFTPHPLTQRQRGNDGRHAGGDHHRKESRVEGTHVRGLQGVGSAMPASRMAARGCRGEHRSDGS